jgi:probable HAF family extracellular repeat protein
VVGYYFDGGPKSFLRSSNGSFSTITSFQGSGSLSGYSGVVAINNAGQLGGSINARGVVITNGVPFSLSTPDAYPYSGVAKINEFGQFVGTMQPSFSDSSQGHGFLYSGGQLTDLGALPGHLYSSANDINDSGVVVGESSLGDSITSRPFRYANGTMTDLGTLGGLASFAKAINAAGDVVGDSMVSGSDWGSVHGFVYRDGGIHDLGTLPGTTISSANDINSAGDIVGACAIAVGQPFYHAFIDRNGVMTDLNSLISPASGWTLQQANGINDDGWIIGVGFTASGGNLRQAFLLQPVPEPSTAPIIFTVASLCLSRSDRRATRRKSRKA